MAKHLNPLEKEFLIRQFKSNRRIRLSDFCTANHVSDAAFRKWLQQYNEGGIEGLARADKEIREVLPEGIDRTEEAYKREILKLISHTPSEGVDKMGLCWAMFNYFRRSRKKTLYICMIKLRVTSMHHEYVVEICAPSYVSALAAQRGGAARIELCSELDLGGVTPSYGLIQEVRAALTIAVNVLVRPRSGDFLYSSYEVETVTRDIALCAQAGVQGVVVGALTADAKVDRAAAAEWLKEARRHGLSTTFHRAIDCADGIYDALEDVASLGYDRVLTSGGCQTAWEGRETIARMQAMMANHTGSHRKPLIIMPGSGINPTNIRDLALQTGVNELHLSATKLHKSGMRVLSGIAQEETVVHSDEETVRRAVAALCVYSGLRLFAKRCPSAGRRRTNMPITVYPRLGYVTFR